MVNGSNVDRPVIGVPVRSRVAWGAIIAGSLVSIGLFLLLGSFWAALDLSMAKHQMAATPIFVAVLSLVAMFAGGWTTSHLAAGESPGEAIFYGIVLWSMTALVLLYLAFNGILVLGSSTILGQTGGEDMLPVSRDAAWWGFLGVAFSLVATLAGVLGGFPGHLRASKRRTKRPALAMHAEPST